MSSFFMYVFVFEKMKSETFESENLREKKRVQEVT